MTAGAGPVASGWGGSDHGNAVSAGRQGSEATTLDGGQGATQAPTGYAPQNMPAAGRTSSAGTLPDDLDHTGPDQSDLPPEPAVMDVTHNPVRFIAPPSGS